MMDLQNQNASLEIKHIYAVWVYVSDINRSTDFYRNKIGLQYKFRNGDWVEFDLGSTSFALLQRPPEKGNVVPVKTRIMFGTDDIQSFYKNALARGVVFTGGIREEEYGSLLTFEDPDGHWLEVYQDKGQHGD